MLYAVKCPTCGTPKLSSERICRPCIDFGARLNRLNRIRWRIKQARRRLRRPSRRTRIKHNRRF